MSTTWTMTRALLACFVVSGISACASRPPAMPANVTVTQRTAGHGTANPLPIVAPNAAAPEIVYMYFNTLDVNRLGHGGPSSVWSGSFVTSTNVASVEVRTNLFSIDVPRKAFGRFAFSVDVLDLPPIFVRAYRLRVLARNSAGVIAEEDLPFRIR